MTSSTELTRFVRDALTRGVPRSQVEEVLLEAGWSNAQAGEALAAFADVTFPVPVPRPRPSTDAREAFLYGVLFVTMFVSAYNLGGLAFVLIDRAFPLETETVTPLREAMRWSVSMLIVAVPVFFFLTRLINRELRLDPGKRISEMRRKLTYLTLFISAFVLIGSFAGLVYSFLGDELTTRFILKTVTAAGIAGGVFWYYLRDMRPQATKT
jgi:hypothetical protein